jgi:thiamine kinase-like enzyme
VGDELDALLDEVACLRGARDVTELGGGLTNRNYKVVSSAGAYVVRVSSKDDNLLSIDRAAEYENSRRAAEAGVGAPVVDFLPEHGLLVVGFVEGDTFTDERLGANLARIAAAVRQLHASERFVTDFDMMRIHRNYLRIVTERGFRLPTDYLDYQARVDDIQRALAVREDALVPCNNDLLAANFIDAGERIWIIDYEYAGNNDACFELGNIASECHLDLDQLEELVTSYYGRRLRNRIARARLQGLMSNYGWTLWASIQDATSKIDFDFWTWGMAKYETARAEFGGAAFAELLDDVQRED